MILKNADDKSNRINKLQELISSSNRRLSRRIEQEIRIVRAETRRGKEASDLIDSHFENIGNAIVLHELRVEINGKLAHIDHLIISPFKRFYLLNTRYFTHGLRVNESGEYLRWCEWRRSFDVTPSPIESGNTNADIFSSVLDSLGIEKPVSIQPYIVLSPKAVTDLSLEVEAPQILKFGQFVRVYEGDMRFDAKNSSCGTSDSRAIINFDNPLKEVGDCLVKLHKPLEINYEEKLTSTDPGGFNRRVSDIVQVDFAGRQVSQSRTGSINQIKICERCTSPKLKLERGRFGCYFHCGMCGTNKLIKIACGTPGHVETLKRKGSKFYRECTQCGSSSLYFENGV